MACLLEFSISSGTFSVAPVTRICRTLRLILAPIFNNKINHSSMLLLLLISARCTTVEKVIMPNLIDNGQTVSSGILISFPAVCSDMNFKHGRLGFIPLCISTKMMVTMAAVSTKALLLFPGV